MTYEGVAVHYLIGGQWKGPQLSYPAPGETAEQIAQQIWGQIRFNRFQENTKIELFYHENGDMKTVPFDPDEHGV